MFKCTHPVVSGIRTATILCCAAVLVSGCASRYKDVEIDTPHAMIKIQRNELGIKRKGDPMQGYDFNNDLNCGSKRYLAATFSFDSEFEEIKRVSAEKPLYVLMDGAEMPGPNVWAWCYSTISFLPVAGHSYVLTQRGRPTAGNCEPVVWDEETRKPPEDLQVRLNSSCIKP